MAAFIQEKFGGTLRQGEALILLAALIYAFYPVLSAFAIDANSPFQFLTGIYVAYAVANIIPALVSPAARAAIWDERDRIWTDGESFVAAATDAFAHLCFFFALMLGSAIVASAIFETWPFVAMLTSFLFLPGHHRFPSLYKLSVSLLAVAGIATLTIQPFESPLTALEPAWSAVTLALAASVLGALASNHHNRLGRRYGIERSIARYFVMQFFRSVHLLIVCVFLQPVALLLDMPSLPNLLNPTFWFAALIGGGIFFVIPLLFRFGVLRSRDEGVFILWYIAPVMTILLLWAFGLDSYSTSKALGSMMVVVANILLAAAPIISWSFALSTASIPLSLFVILSVGGRDTENYFDIISTFAIVFTLLYGIILNRIWRARSALQADLSALARHLIRHDAHRSARLRLLEILANARDGRRRYRAYLKLARIVGVDPPEDGPRILQHLDMVAATQSELRRLSEVLIVTLLALGWIAVSVTFRPGSLVGDIVAVLMCFSSTYMTSRLFELRARPIPTPNGDLRALPTPTMSRGLFRRLSWGDHSVFVFSALTWAGALYILAGR